MDLERLAFELSVADMDRDNCLRVSGMLSAMQLRESRSIHCSHEAGCLFRSRLFLVDFRSLPLASFSNRRRHRAGGEGLKTLMVIYCLFDGFHARR